jgi:hypothetical protein
VIGMMLMAGLSGLVGLGGCLEPDLGVGPAADEPAPTPFETCDV